MTKTGEKISPELELQIIEQRLMDIKLSTNKAIIKFDLKCSKANVQKVYAKWGLSRIKKPVSIRGVISTQAPAAALVICPKCAGRVPATSKFCSECGERLTPPAVGTIKCPKCSKLVPATSKFCPECGEKIEGK